MAGVIRKVLLAGVTRVATKAIRQVPVLGTAVVFGMAGYEMKKKGMLEGLANVALDATPVVGVAKNAIELVTGDWFPDRENPDRHKKEQRPRFSRHSGAEWAPFFTTCRTNRVAPVAEKGGPGNEDEKFSYLIFTGQPGARADTRIIVRPARQPGLTRPRLRAPEGREP